MGYKDVSGMYLARPTVYTAVILRVPERKGDFESPALQELYYFGLITHTVHEFINWYVIRYY